MQRLKEERNESVRKASERIVSKKSLEKNAAGNRLTASVALKKVRCQKNELAKMKGENELLTRTTEELLADRAETAGPAGRTDDKLAESLAPRSLF